MIKKSVFENEIIAGMQRELTSKNIKQGMTDLGTAVDHINNAIGIFEEAKMTSVADKLLDLLYKIAAHSNVRTMPGVEQLMHMGMTPNDIRKASKGDIYAKYKLNSILRSLNYEQKDIVSFLGKTYLSDDQMIEVKSRIDAHDESANVINNLLDQTLTPEKLAPVKRNVSDIKLPESAKLPETIRMTRASDRHTHKLTPEQMIKNLKDHSTVFNMADDNKVDMPMPRTFEEDYQRWLAKKEAIPPTQRMPRIEEIEDPSIMDGLPIDNSSADDPQGDDKDPPYADWEDE